MGLESYEINEAMVESLASIENSQPAIALLQIAKQIYDRETLKLVEGQKGVSDTEPKNDFRYSMGMAQCAREILSLHNEAKKMRI